MNTVKFYGFDILRYYYYAWQNNYAEYSWQIKVAYSIVVLSILLLFVILIYFLYKYYKKEKYNKVQKKVFEKYNDIIENLLLSNNTDSEYIVDTLKDIDRKIDASHYIKLLINIRLKHTDIEYLQNMQIISNELGIRSYIEYNLLTNKQVFESLQCLVMLQLEIAEGRLANYINHKNVSIRTFARIAYIYCSTNEPYRFLEKELEEKQGSLNTMLLHYVFGWMNIQDKVLPDFMYFAKKVSNDDTASFMLNEMKYFNKVIDKEDLIYFYNSNKHKTKKTAIMLSRKLKYDDISAQLLDMYNEQKYDIKQTIIKTLAYSGKEKAVSPLVSIYKKAESRTIKETILIELARLQSNLGVNAFKELEYEMKKDQLLFNNVESLIALKQIKKLYKNNEF